MKSIALAVCIFCNLIVIGTFGYFYLLWTQYWSSTSSDTVSLTRKSIYDKQIYYYNRGYPNETTNENNVIISLIQTGHTTIKQNLIDLLMHKRNSRQTSIKNESSIRVVNDKTPRFLNLQASMLQLDSDMYTCGDRNEVNCSEKTAIFKNKLLMELQRIYMKESNNFKTNPYDVRYVGPRESYLQKSAKQLLCEMKQLTSVETIKKHDAPFDAPEFANFFPNRNMFFRKHFNSCAIIASAGSLLQSKLGSIIDHHDLVLRFNHAPTEGYEDDVGTKTTMRVLNSQVVSKPDFAFLTSPLYRNVTILIWDPSNYTASLREWHAKPEHNLFPNFQQFRRQNPRNKVFLLNPKSLWSVWNFLQRNSPNRLRKNPPSSGFLALAHLLNHCSYVDMFEYVPSVRITKKCHYFDTDDNPSCTFGAWHPLAAEKLIAYAMNVADDYLVFQRGFIRIPGYSLVQC